MATKRKPKGGRLTTPTPRRAQEIESRTEAKRHRPTKRKLAVDVDTELLAKARLAVYRINGETLVALVNRALAAEVRRLERKHGPFEPDDAPEQLPTGRRIAP